MPGREKTGGARLTRALRFLHRRADNIAVILLTAMFGAFILQIFFRYVIKSPLSWTLEACLIAWLWTVFWGSAFLLKDGEHVRFDIFYLMAPKRVRRVFALISAVAIVAAFVVSFPAVWNYITFMSIEKSSVIKIRLDFLFSVYLIFAVAIIVRYAVRAYNFATGRDPDRELEDPLAAYAGDDPEDPADSGVEPK